MAILEDRVRDPRNDVGDDQHAQGTENAVLVTQHAGRNDDGKGKNNCREDHVAGSGEDRLPRHWGIEAFLEDRTAMRLIKAELEDVAGVAAGQPAFPVKTGGIFRYRAPEEHVGAIITIARTTANGTRN